MFWKKKNEVVEKLNEEELIASDNDELEKFDNAIKIIGKFVIYYFNNSVNAKYTMQEAIEKGAQIKECTDMEWRKKGYKFEVKCNISVTPFYDYNKAQQFLEKYLLLLSSKNS